MDSCSFVSIIPICTGRGFLYAAALNLSESDPLTEHLIKAGKIDAVSLWEEEIELFSPKHTG